VAPAAGDVDRLPGGERGPRRQQIGLDHVVHVGEIARLLPVAIDERALPAEDVREEDGNHGRVLGIRRLPRTEHVEVAQGDGLEAVHVVEYPEIFFAGELRHAIGGDRDWALILALGQVSGVAVHRGRAGEDDPPHARRVRGDQQVERARHVHLVGERGIGDRALDRGQGRLVEHELDSGHRPLDDLRLPQVAREHFQAVARGLELEIPAVAGREVVEDPNAVSVAEEPRGKVRTDESGAACDEDLLHAYLPRWGSRAQRRTIWSPGKPLSAFRASKIRRA